jgi:hypothetical protein
LRQIFGLTSFFYDIGGGKIDTFTDISLLELNSIMNCCDYKIAFAPLLTGLVFCVWTADAFGQVKAAAPQAIEIAEVEIAPPAVELGDSEGNARTPSPVQDSPQPIAVPGKKPVAEPDTPTLKMPPNTARQNRTNTTQGGSSTPGEDYWKPTSGTTDTLEKTDAETARDRFNAASIRKLRKPMQDIRIVAEDNAAAPKNLAARFMVKEPVLKIVAAGISPPRPDRYPIQFKHRPLYYEQPLLERCGRGCCFAQNAISAGQFCMNTFFLPYHMCKTRPDCPVVSGGDCLSCKPYSLNCNVLPLSYKGLATEAAAFAGFTFLML